MGNVIKIDLLSLQEGKENNFNSNVFCLWIFIMAGKKRNHDNMRGECLIIADY